MNYRHDYHAGNVGDVLKHVVLTLILEHLRAKPKPILVLDTHAGAGAFDLAGDAASRTGEWRGGIGRLLDADEAPAALRPYLDLVRGVREARGATLYPGSPLIAALGLRPGDRLVAVERHPDAHAALAALLARRPGVRVEAGDGYASLAALLPPPERRGLVLIDPPFEDRAEYQALATALAHAHRRFATGVFMLWYPIKDPGAVEAFHQQVIASGIARVLAAELTTRPTTTIAGLAGAGLILVNPPWRLEETLRDLLPWLAARLAEPPGAGGWWLDWLRGEA
ncbi:23S rRNA (adenine(2030)-N(6))-methyltransferase RlmJ [uncultured Rhodospira sp.]|uniref:23S rRNA (adenine(2030)-N(6))-methyltransferase RlmJ n=1 Tax=uncultured Rhodospira sp. TaxID=1936189 RepID=UPI002632EBEF|nr:23S rRNA (adenine(2030)-N(6))-methyltransferase RlmJ [uncultured Rhodospira sp.]